MIDTPNLRIHRIEGAQTTTQTIGSLFNEILAKHCSKPRERNRHAYTQGI